MIHDRSKLKLKHKGCYVTADKKVVEIRIRGSHLERFADYPFEDSDGWWYTEDGQCFEERKNIVAEVMFLETREPTLWETRKDIFCTQTGFQINGLSETGISHFINFIDGDIASEKIQEFIVIIRKHIKSPPLVDALIAKAKDIFGEEMVVKK